MREQQGGIEGRRWGGRKEQKGHNEGRRYGGRKEQVGIEGWR